MIFASRKDRAPDPYLERKIQLFFLGAALALVGIALDSSLLVGLAILILAGGMALRFLSRPPADDDEAEGQEGKNTAESEGSAESR